MKTAAAMMLTLAPGVAAAQADTILVDALNGGVDAPVIGYAFTREGCAATAMLEQEFDGGIHQATTTRFDLGALEVQRYGLTDFSPALPLGELALPLLDGAEAEIDIVLTQVPDDQVGTFTAQGFACADATCTRSLTAPEVKLPFGGSDPASRSLIILSRLEALASTCAAQ